MDAPGALERLPAEIRTNIWELAFSDGPYVCPFGYRERHFLYQDTPGPGCRQCQSSRPEATGLLYVNKQYADETKTALFRTRVFKFHNLEQTFRFFGSTRKQYATALRHIELDFKAEDYLEFLSDYMPLRRMILQRWLLYTLPVVQPVGEKASELARYIGTELVHLRMSVRMPKPDCVMDLAMENCCFLLLCEWVVKAFKDCFAGNQNIALAFDYEPRDWRSSDLLPRDDIEWLQRFESTASDTSWRDLNIENARRNWCQANERGPSMICCCSEDPL